MTEQVKWGLLFALENDIEEQLNFIKARPNWWWDSPDSNNCKHDTKNLVDACDWLLNQNLPHYVNLGYFRRDLEKLRELL